MRLLGWVCIWFGVFGIAFFGYNLYTPDLVRMQQSIVLLEVRQDCGDAAEHPGERCKELLGHASGVILEDGYILTAGHVANSLDHDGLEIVVKFRHGQETTAELVDYKFDVRLIGRDIALLRVDNTFDYPAATINCSTLPVGTSLYVVGHPAITLWTVTQGYVMGTVPRRGREAGDWLAIDGTVWKGNSGGPVFNRWGQIVGIISHGITAGFGSPVGLNYAASGPIICEFLGEIDEYNRIDCSYRYPFST